MKKIPTIILLFLFSVFTIIFLFFPKIIFPEKEIVGCKQPKASNYNIKANVNDTTLCKYIKQPTKELSEMVDSLANNPWDEIKYSIIRTSIKSYYKSVSKEGWEAEEIALKNLDNNYMKVLYDESKKVSKNCYINYSDISNEVDKFYKKYQNNSDVKSARSILSIRKKSQSYKSKVKKLLSKKYDRQKYDDLDKDINNFINSSRYKSYLKKCNKLSLGSTYTKLKNFSNIEFKFKAFNKKKHKFRNEVPLSEIMEFENYDWYHNEVKKIDNDLKNKKNKWFNKLMPISK